MSMINENIEEMQTECILVNFIEPILFVKKSNNGDRHIILLYDDEKGKYLMAKTNSEKLLRMLHKEVSMRSLFVNAVDNEMYIAEWNFHKERYIVRNIKKDNVTDAMLPKKDAVFSLNNNNIQKYVRNLECEQKEMNKNKKI